MDDQKLADDRRLKAVQAEHASLEEKVRHASGDLYRTETIVPVAIAVTYAWLYGRPTGAGAASSWMWWIPVAVACFGAVRQRLRYKSLWGHHHYLKALEREIYGAPPVRGPRPQTFTEREAGAYPPYGWEEYWSWAVSPRLGSWAVSPHGLMRIVFWALLITGTVALAVEKTVL